LTSLTFFCLLVARPPRSTLFPSRRSSDLALCCAGYWHAMLYLHTARGVRGERAAGCGIQRRKCRIPPFPACAQLLGQLSSRRFGDRKSTRLNSSHVKISYAVFCLKKKKKK